MSNITLFCARTVCFTLFYYFIYSIYMAAHLTLMNYEQLTAVKNTTQQEQYNKYLISI